MEHRRAGADLQRHPGGPALSLDGVVSRRRSTWRRTSRATGWCMRAAAPIWCASPTRVSSAGSRRKGSARIVGFALRRRRAQQPQRHRHPLGRVDLLHRSELRTLERLHRPRAQARARFPGGLQGAIAPARACSCWSGATSSSSPTGSASRRTSHCCTSTTRRAASVDSFEVAADGSLGESRVFFSGLGAGAVEDNAADGMKFDVLGNISARPSQNA